MAREPRVFAPDELFRFGIEEEYFLSDSETFAAPTETPDALFDSADCCTTGRIGREFLQAQIEVATEPHCNVNEARLELWHLRQSAASAAAEHDLAILACGTHPSVAEALEADLGYQAHGGRCGQWQCPSA